MSKKQADKIKHYINIGIEEGAEVYAARTQNEMHENAIYIQPTIFTNVKNEQTIAQEEIFGPVVVVMEVNDLNEALHIANDTKYGLAAAVWTDDLNEAYQIAKGIRAGLVHINSYGDDDNMAPFGGIKESGIGKDKSMYAFDEYSIVKTTWMHFETLPS